MMRWLVGAAVLAAVAIEARPAAACSGWRRCGDFVLPVDGGTVPQNVDALLVDATNVALDSLSLIEIGSGRSIPVTVEAGPELYPWAPVVRVTPGEPLVAGTTYLVRSERPLCEPDDRVESRFTVTPAVPVPATLGEIRIVEMLQGDLQVGGGGACFEVIEAAQVRIALDHAPEVQPWADALYYLTIVDGVVYRPSNDYLEIVPPGHSWVGRAEDRLYTNCSGEMPDGIFPGFEPGVHRVRFEAHVLAGGGHVTLSTEEVAVALRCRRIGGGCSVGGATPIGAGLWLLLAGAFLVRRRRT